ncbi:MAG: hypothetical protein ACK47M_04405 [Caldilinea sp.]
MTPFTPEAMTYKTSSALNVKYNANNVATGQKTVTLVAATVHVLQHHELMGQLIDGDH